jgi:acyl-CoA thioesterase FadM
MEESAIRFVVGPQDLDAYGHMNNGRYLAIMDLGRLDLMIRNGILKTCLKQRWQPVVAGITIDYRKSLSPLAGFQLHTRLMGWVEKWLYVSETFQREGQEIAHAVVKMAVLGGKGQRVTIRDLAEATGHFDESPPMPRSGVPKREPESA